MIIFLQKTLLWLAVIGLVWAFVFSTDVGFIDKPFVSGEVTE
jgi:hypothetical protein